jgi:hypothetical protein
MRALNQAARSSLKLTSEVELALTDEHYGGITSI